VKPRSKTGHSRPAPAATGLSILSDFLFVLIDLVFAVLRALVMTTLFRTP